jgi:membrane protein YqaA with SNARE-associated domain
MDEFLIALAGGSVGAIVTWLLGQGAAMLAAPSEVATHNQLGTADGIEPARHGREVLGAVGPGGAHRRKR